MNSIPASKFVNVIPGVLGTGGNPLSLNAVFGTASVRVPIGTVQAFGGLQDVENFFGPNSAEAALAAVYFNGFTGATRLPSTLYFAQYNVAAVAGYLRSGSFVGVTLAQLQAFSGSLTVSVDGVSHVSAAIDLSTATSFTNAAALITAGLTAGTPSTAAVCSYDAQLAAFVITSTTTGAASAVLFATNTLSANLKFTAATGAVQSAGAIAATPAGFLNGVVNVTQNWATFTTTFQPDDATMVGFATWVNSSSPAGNERFLYVGEVTDITLTEGPVTNTFPGLTAAFNGRAAVYSDPTLVSQYGLTAAFVCAIAASTNWAAPNGRVDYDFRASSLLTPSVTNLTASNNLDANGVNYYSAVATANTPFRFLTNGQVSGDWEWIDEYVNQIYLNSQIQLALMSLLTQSNALPYNQAGYSLIRSAMLAPINEAKNNGSIVTGVALSPAQVQALIQATGGIDISGTLFQQGWYLQVLDPGAQARGNRTSPLIALWYTDGGSIQQITLSSTDIQ